MWFWYVESYLVCVLLVRFGCDINGGNVIVSVSDGYYFWNMVKCDVISCSKSM